MMGNIITYLELDKYESEPVCEKRPKPHAIIDS